MFDNNNLYVLKKRIGMRSYIEILWVRFHA